VIGVQVQSGEARDAARVTEVSPGGAAQAAGLREGDEILAVDGRELGAGGDPAAALVAITRELEPEKAVKLRVRRDGRNQEIEVRPRPAPRTMVLGARPGGEFRFAGPPGDIRAPVAGVGPMLFEFEHLAPLAGMELATLSERLGSYFGAKEGVLVVRAGNQDAWKLQDGDVILSIDGREPESAAHATRILRSYHRGEKLQIKVLRQRRNETLDVTLPEAGPRGPGGEGGAVRRE
jgi:S1-C subfamily serine protease